ncbi:hypothetical protein AVEN_130659-1 [Araneus ventricosus]|uniref:Uncharacterized protein n=1 Tax=Araneus ventricosus TaxID=182803 RepID=A0A4Y2Q8X0_ARAVE|nr:hypothetical protein AVEN_130659-1 [Araneus ventricosus]
MRRWNSELKVSTVPILNSDPPSNWRNLLTLTFALGNALTGYSPSAASKNRNKEKKRPCFVTLRSDFAVMLDILKLSAPSLQSKIANRFLKLTVKTEDEYRKIPHELSSQAIPRLFQRAVKKLITSPFSC